MQALAGLLARCLLLAGLIAASVWSIRTALADYSFDRLTLRDTEKAVQWSPSQAAYHVRLAQFDTDDRTDALQHAVTLNPADAAIWIELGLRYEAKGDRRKAEECLVRAAQEDKQYLPRWTLANYYFRQGDETNFWTWAKESATMMTGDPLPFFQLCSRLVEDGNLIERLSIERPDVRGHYLYYLLTRGRADLTPRAARIVLKDDREADVPILMSACERLLDIGQGDEALAIWNGLAGAHRIGFGNLSRENGKGLTNGSFTLQPSSHGFDWRLPVLEGVSASREENPTGIRLTFSGREPEKCEPLFQFVPVEEKTAYILRFRYRTSQIRSDAGLHWRISDLKHVLNEGESLSSEAETQREVSFVTPANCRLLRMSLSYDRSPGTTRAEGFIALRDVELRASRP